MGFDEVISYGNGMVLLFYGSSGTGKTMMVFFLFFPLSLFLLPLFIFPSRYFSHFEYVQANSVANHLQKKVLLINFPSLGSMSAGENFKFIFRYVMSKRS